MVGHGGSSASSYLADPTSPIPSHCALIVVTSTLRVNCIIIAQTNKDLLCLLLTRVAVKVLGLCIAKVQNENDCYTHRLIHQLNEQDLLCHSI